LSLVKIFLNLSDNLFRILSFLILYKAIDFKGDVISSAHELYGQILEVISLIPCGKVATYGQVARLAGLPKHARLVGYILKNLPIETDIPWHRVINSQGRISLSKLNTQGQNIQSVLLIEEGLTVINGKINLKKFQWLP